MVQIFSETWNRGSISEWQRPEVIKRRNNDHCPKRDKDWPQCRSLLSTSSIFRDLTRSCQQPRRVLERDSLLPLHPQKRSIYARAPSLRLFPIALSSALWIFPSRSFVSNDRVSDVSRLEIFWLREWPRLVSTIWTVNYSLYSEKI